MLFDGAVLTSFYESTSVGFASRLDFPVLGSWLGMALVILGTSLECKLFPNVAQLPSIDNPRASPAQGRTTEIRASSKVSPGPA